MKKFEHRLDLIVETLLCRFSSHLIYRVASEIKVDPDDVALLIKGVVHNHWYIADDVIEGCHYCERIKRFNRSSDDGVPAIPIKVSTTNIRDDNGAGSGRNRGHDGSQADSTGLC